MNTSKCFRSFFLASITVMILINFSFAQDNSANETLSPYFVVISDEEDVSQFPLESTDVDVRISGVMADITVTQTYTNNGDSTIEAVYIFPASTRAAVHNMVMKVDDREIRAVIEERDEAKKIYEEARKEGKRASLLEEKRPNVFRMSVANITPSSKVEVELSYTELLIPEEGVYEFVYPTVVGPRYVSKSEYRDGVADPWAGNPYLEKEDVSVSAFNLNMILTNPTPVQEVLCETHECDIDFLDENKVRIVTTKADEGNHDFITKYRLAGDQIQTGMMFYEDKGGENYFMAMLQPPKRIKPENIPPREYIFIMDVSGSMSGFPMSVSKNIMTELLRGLRPDDRFNILQFAGDSKVFSRKSLPADQENIRKANQFVLNSSGGGGTELYSAMKRALKLSVPDDNVSRSFVIMTDGYVTLENRTFDLIRKNLGSANVFAFGMGTSVNRFLIEGMAHAGGGKPFFAINEREAKKQAGRFLKYISNPVLTDIQISFEGFRAYDILPAQVPDLFASRPLIVSGKYEGEAAGSIIVKGYSGNMPYQKQVSVSKQKEEKDKALKYLWAREKIRLISDYEKIEDNKELQEQLVKLGKEYNLLTRYTSFVAVDSLIVNEGGEQVKIKQPSPLPEGVSEHAIGATASVSSSLNIISEEETGVSKIFMVAEKMPEFPGGQEALMEYLEKNLNYPEKLQEKGITGTVYVTFVVNKNGGIEDVRVLRSLHPLLDKEAVRVVKSMPKWKPGEQRGKKVNIQYNLPIRFSLD